MSNKITLYDLWDRDKGICYLCGKRTDHPHSRSGKPNSPTRDHVIPRARGGRNAQFNIRLAHYRCNQLKADKRA